MKRWIAFLLCVWLICSLTACAARTPAKTVRENAAVPPLEEDGASAPAAGEEEPLRVTLTTRATLRVDRSMQRSGIRFLTTVSAAAVARLRERGTVSFGTLVAPIHIIKANNATHEKLRAAGKQFLDIPTAGAFSVSGDDFVFAGSVNHILRQNYGRTYAGVGYISLTEPDGTVTYYYAEWGEGNRSSIYALARDAYIDRTTRPDKTHVYPVDGGYSPYTAEQCAWLGEYLYSVANVLVVTSPRCAAIPLPENRWYTAPYDITVTANGDDYTITLTVKQGVDYNFAVQCAALLHDGALMSRITDARVARDPIARAHKYYIDPDGHALYYYYSSYSASY